MNIYIWSEFVPEEKIIYKMNADSSGYLYIPTMGAASSGAYSTYNWKISVDGGAETTYSGTGSSGSSITLSGYTAGTSHTIMITPTTEEYGWARAYSWRGLTNANKVTEIVYDSSYMGYGVSATDTGNYFRGFQYRGCTNLTKPVEEYIPNTVTTIGNNFRSQQYYLCTALTYAAEEYLPNSITTIGSNYRATEYSECSAITYAPEESLPSSVTSIGTLFRSNQYNSCSSLTEIKGWKDLSIGNSSYRLEQFYSCNSNKTVKVLSDVGYDSDSYALVNDYVTSVSVPSAYLTNFKNSSNYPWVGITDSKFIGY